MLMMITNMPRRFGFSSQYARTCTSTRVSTGDRSIHQEWHQTATVSRATQHTNRREQIQTDTGGLYRYYLCYDVLWGRGSGLCAQSMECLFALNTALVWSNASPCHLPLLYLLVNNDNKKIAKIRNTKLNKTRLFSLHKTTSLPFHKMQST